VVIKEETRKKPPSGCLNTRGDPEGVDQVAWEKFSLPVRSWLVDHTKTTALWEGEATKELGEKGKPGRGRVRADRIEGWGKN